MYSITPVVKYLIVINIVLFGLTLVIPHYGLILFLGLHYFELPEFKPFQLFTNFFMHANIPHIAFNMISLYSVGMMLERIWGPKRFLNFYLICGLGAGIVHSAYYYLSIHYLGGFAPPVSVGASGAIFGLFTAVALLFPNTEFLIMFIPIPIKAKHLWFGLVIIDLILGLTNFTGDFIGHWAHLGGVITGLILVRYYHRKKTNFY